MSEEKPKNESVKEDAGFEADRVNGEKGAPAGVSESLGGIADGFGSLVDGVKDNLGGIRDDLGELAGEVKGGIDDASAVVRRIEDAYLADAKANKRFPKVMKAFGIVLIISGLLHCAGHLLTMALAAFVVYEGYVTSIYDLSDLPTMMGVIFSAVLFALVLVSSVFSIVLGVRLLRNHRSKAAFFANLLMFLELASLIVSFMLYGISFSTFVSLGYVVLLGLLSVYSDPTLRRERVTKRREASLEAREEKEAGTLGLDKSGKGYIKLDFFNLFWIFVVCCFLGLVIETVYHMTVIDLGVYQNRAGLLYGPFSPIYGFGGVMITVVLNRFHKSNPVIVFLAAAFIGALFEYLVSWWMETSFGITAWDYTGTFLNVGGRTNFMFFCMWGCLGILWLRFILPKLLLLINRIPWNWRYSLTLVCAVLMFIDCGLTVASFDRWFERQADIKDTLSITALEQFCDENYDDDYMKSRFQTMSINVGEATRVS